MRVLVACEESQEVCKAFRERGHVAFSCDLLECSGGRPEWHLRGDVFQFLDQGWDMMIAHPPCTHLSVAGASHWKRKQQYGIQREAIDFFETLLEFDDIPKICIENPPGIISKEIRKPDQYIQPYEHGHPFKKKTGLWLNGLPLLVPSNIVEPISYWSQPHGSAYNAKSMTLNSKGGHRDQKIRSKTFPGIAKAMAEQWG